MNNDEKISESRKTELKLFQTIFEWERINNHSKEFTDKEMQDRIKKQIQTLVKIEEN